MENSSKINCPNCDAEINVNDILKHQIEEKLKFQLNRERSEFLKQQKEAKSLLDLERISLKEAKQSQQKELGDKLEEQRKVVQKEIRETLEAKISEENATRIEAMQKELLEKSEKVKELYTKDAEIERLKRDNEEAKIKANLDAQKSLSEQLKIERAKIKEQEQEASNLVIIELKQQIEQQKKLTAEMQRKQEQGSMQVQGEVLEIAIEEWLASTFPLDTIEEIKKGANGADCLQTVHTRTNQNCGTIYYESKRTKSFQPSWIEKFKNDIRDKCADVGILVTEVLPADMTRMGLYDGVWVCTFSEFKGLSLIMREHILKLNTALATQENKADKTALLYDYLTSNEFRLHMEAIFEGFQQMQIDLVKEKTAMQRLWKKREKQIDKVVINATKLQGAVKGIAGNAIGDIKILELGE